MHKSHIIEHGEWMYMLRLTSSVERGQVRMKGHISHLLLLSLHFLLFFLIQLSTDPGEREGEGEERERETHTERGGERGGGGGRKRERDRERGGEGKERERGGGGGGERNYDMKACKSDG